MKRNTRCLVKLGKCFRSNQLLEQVPTLPTLVVIRPQNPRIVVQKLAHAEAATV